MRFESFFGLLVPRLGEIAHRLGDAVLDAVGVGLLLFEGLDAGGQRGVGLLVAQCDDRGLERLLLGFQRGGQLGLQRLDAVELPLQRRQRGLARVAFVRRAVDVDDGDDGLREGLRRSRGPRRARRPRRPRRPVRRTP